MGAFKSGDRIVCLSVGMSCLLKIGASYTVDTSWCNERGEYVTILELRDKTHNYAVNKFKLDKENLFDNLYKRMTTND